MTCFFRLLLCLVTLHILPICTRTAHADTLTNTLAERSKVSTITFELLSRGSWVESLRSPYNQPLVSVMHDIARPRLLRRYWHVLNDRARPFAMSPGGYIVAGVTSLTLDVRSYTALINRCLSELNQTASDISISSKVHCFSAMPRRFCKARGGNHTCNCSKLTSNTQSDVALEMEMARELRLVLKIFELHDWWRLTREDGGPSAEGGGSSMVARDPSILCRAPSLYRVAIDVMKMAPVEIVIWHSRHRSHLVAVLVQCSNLPLTLDIVMQMANADGKGSAEYDTTKSVFVVFLVAYVLLFVIMLLLIIPCFSHRQGKKTCGGEDATASSIRLADKKDGNTVHCANNTSTCSGNEQTSDEELHEKKRKEKGALDSANDLESMTELNQENPHPSNSSTRGREPCTIYSRVRRYLGHHLHILYPPLQWLVLACLVSRALVCLLRVTLYRELSQNDRVIANSGVEIPTLILTVSSQAAVFAMQQFVCVGWGCAYERLPTSKLLIASVCSFIGFVVYIVDSTCDTSDMSTTFTALDESRRYAKVRCISIGIARRACEILATLLNLFQLTSLMATIGRAAATGETPNGETYERFKDNTKLYLRYRSMCVPYAVGVLLPQVLFIAFSETLMGFDDYYVECALTEFVVWFALVFVLLFLRKEPLYT